VIAGRARVLAPTAATTKKFGPTLQEEKNPGSDKPEGRMPFYRAHGYLREGFDIIAHRGSQTLWPENTMLAFENAVKVYPDLILEIDVRRTKDGHVVVFHDRTTERICEQSCRILNTNLEDLRRLDAAYCFTNNHERRFPYRGQNITIPTLKEVLERFPHNRISVEIKDVKRGHVADVLRLIESMGAINRVIIGSEYDLNLRAARRLDTRFATGYAIGDVLRALCSDNFLKGKLFPLGGDVLQIPLWHKVGPGRGVVLRVFSESLLHRAHKAGKRVHVWTINDKRQMRELIEMGVDGIVTDAVGLLVKVARELKKIDS